MGRDSFCPDFLTRAEYQCDGMIAQPFTWLFFLTEWKIDWERKPPATALPDQKIAKSKMVKKEKYTILNNFDSFTFFWK